MDQVSQPYKTDKTVVLLYSDSKLEDKSHIKAAYFTVIQTVCKSNAFQLINQEMNWQTQFCTTSGLCLPCMTIIIHIYCFGVSRMEHH